MLEWGSIDDEPQETITELEMPFRDYLLNEITIA